MSDIQDLRVNTKSSFSKLWFTLQKIVDEKKPLFTISGCGKSISRVFSLSEISKEISEYQYYVSNRETIEVTIGETLVPKVIITMKRNELSEDDESISPMSESHDYLFRDMISDLHPDWGITIDLDVSGNATVYYKLFETVVRTLQSVKKEEINICLHASGNEISDACILWNMIQRKYPEFTIAGWAQETKRPNNNVLESSTSESDSDSEEESISQSRRYNNKRKRRRRRRNPTSRKITHIHIY